MATMSTGSAVMGPLPTTNMDWVVEKTRSELVTNHYLAHSPYGHADLYTAWPKAQSEFTTVKKDKNIDRGPGKKPFKYADLADVLEMAIPILSKYDLALVQKIRLTDQGPRLVTKIIHSSGQFEEDDGIRLDESASNQDFGKSLTYARRYGACAMLGIVSDEDTDGPDPIPHTPPAAPIPPGAPNRAIVTPPPQDDAVTEEDRAWYKSRILATGKKLDEAVIYIRAKSGVTDTRLLNRQQFDAAVTSLEAAVKNGTFDEVVHPKEK